MLSLYATLHHEANPTLTMRCAFIIDPEKKILLILTYSSRPDRNVNEILRVINSFQFTDERKVATRADWKWVRKLSSRLTCLTKNPKYYSTRLDDVTPLPAPRRPRGQAIEDRTTLF